MTDACLIMCEKLSLCGWHWILLSEFISSSLPDLFNIFLSSLTYSSFSQLFHFQVLFLAVFFCEFMTKFYFPLGVLSFPTWSAASQMEFQSLQTLNDCLFLFVRSSSHWIIQGSYDPVGMATKMCMFCLLRLNWCLNFHVHEVCSFSEDNLSLSYSRN